MKDTWILLLTVLAASLAVLTSQYLRGDFSSPPGQYAAIQTDLEGWAVQGGDGGALVNVNRADAETLCLLDGIGQTLSRRIVEYREENGPFRSLDELKQVQGIGEETLNQLLPRLTLGE